VKYEWDERKNQINIRKHGFDFADATEIFDGPMIVNADTREDYGEARWIGLGEFRGRVVVVVFTEPTPDLTRIISLRKALKHEREYYEKRLKDQLGLD
jgi:uncharacterized protein